MDTTNFQAILDTLQTADYLPDRIDRQYLEQIGYTSTSDALVPGVLKELNLIDKQEAPTDLLQVFRDQHPSKKVVAKGMVEAYRDLFQDHPSIHNLSKREVVEIFNEHLEGEKSNIVIDYMANTFRTMVDYVEPSQIEAILNEEKSGQVDEDFPDEEDALNSNLDDNMSSNHVEKKKSPGRISDVVAFNDSLVTKRVEQEPTLVDRAYIKRANLLFKLGRYQQALPAMEEVYQRFADSDNTKLYHQATATLVKKMELMESLEMQDELLYAYEQVIERLGQTEQTGFTKQVDDAYINRAKILLKTGQSQQALDALDDAITRFKRTGRNPDNLAEIMYNKAQLLEELGRDEDALEAYEDLLLAFDDH